MSAMTPASLVIGSTGYVGRTVTSALRVAGVAVRGSSRIPGRADEVVASPADLDRVVTDDVGQIVVTAHLAGTDMQQVLERIDGPRWLVFSSAQVLSRVPAPNTELALAREQQALAAGATVVRPTMIFGRGGDLNISRLVKLLRRWRVLVQVGDGHQLVQPIHVDDVAALVVAHSQHPKPGLYAAGGADRVTTRELLATLRSAVGVRSATVTVPASALRQIARLPVPGLRPDQVLRLEEDKVVDIGPTCAMFQWTPIPLVQRLRQAVGEVPRPPANRPAWSRR